MRFCSMGAFIGTLLMSVPAMALQIEVPLPPPTLDGEETEITAQLVDVAGTAEIRWDFGDGTVIDFSDGELTASHFYAAPGHYTVNVLAQDDNGFASATFIHTVHTPPMEVPARVSSPLAYDPARGIVAAANEDNGTVTLVDADSLETIQEVTVFDQPVALAFAPDGLLWVVDRADFAVTIVDVDEGRAVDFFRLPYASQPIGIVFDQGGDAYIPLFAVGDVVRIDGTTFELEATRHIVPHLRGITISGDDTSLWVTRFISQGDHGEVYRLDTSTLDTVVRYDLLEDTTTEDSDVQGRGLPNYLFAVGVSPDGSRGWVPSKKDNMSRGLMRDGLAITQDNAVRPLVSILDLDADEELFDERIDLDDRNLPRHVGFSPLGDWAFVSVFGSNLVELRDAYNGSSTATLRAPELKGPAASLLGPQERLFVLADSSRHLIVFGMADLLTGVDQTTQILAEIPLVAHEKLSTQVLLGKQVFENAEDKRMASEGYLSCSSCHFEGFEDGLVWDFFDRGEGFRNTTSLLGRRGTGHGRVHWSGNFDEIQDFENPIRAHQGGLGFLSPEDFATGTVGEPLGDPKAGLSEDLDAMAAYVESLNLVPRSPFRNADGTLTDDGVAGRDLFLQRQCDSCHGGDDYTDSIVGAVHDVGTMTMLSGSRLGEELPGIDTPTLLGVWQTAPYLHDGSAPTLRDVLTTRNPDDEHGVTSDLSSVEIDQLVSYLQQIDHDIPPKDLTLPMNPPVGGGGAGGEDNGSPNSGGDAQEGSGGSLAPVATGGEPGDSGGETTTTGDEVNPPSDSGCGCRIEATSGRRQDGWWTLLAGGLIFGWRRRLRLRARL